MADRCRQSPISSPHSDEDAARLKQRQLSSRGTGRAGASDSQRPLGYHPDFVP
jgi:hypothetical protein